VSRGRCDRRAAEDDPAVTPADDDPLFRAPRQEGDETLRRDAGREAQPRPFPQRRRAPAGRARASATQRRRLLALIVLAVAIAAGFALRVALIDHKYEFHNDEAFSYIEATGHMNAFRVATAGGHMNAFRVATAGGLSARWVPAERWQSMWQPDAVLGLRDIAAALARYDTHPPLYYWILHFWLLIVGMHVWSGPVLNLFISALAGLALFGLARRLLRHDVDAALVTLTWSLSRVVVATSSLARNYDLLTVLVVLFVWLLVDVSDAQRPPRKLALVALGLVTATAFLTHYQFLLAVAGAVVFALGSAWLSGCAGRAQDRHPWRRSASTLVAMVAGLGLTILLHPGMFNSFRVARNMQMRPSVEAFLGKVDAVVNTVASAFGVGTAWLDTLLAGALPPDRAPWLRPSVLLLVAAVAAGVALVAIPRLRRTVYARLGPPGANGLPAIFFAAWLGGAIVAQNLAFMSQPHFMSGRYLSMAWPFCAFLPLLAFRVLVKRWAELLTLAYCLLLLLPLSVLAPIRYDSRLPTPFPAFSSAHRVVVNTTGPGQLINALWSVQGTALVYADKPKGLLAGSQAWIAPLARGDCFAYFNYGAERPAARCLRRLEKERRLQLLTGSVTVRGAYRVTGPR
jgi:Dolichyl-phosphate-mannose-protein mannosyltransferase